MRLKDVEANISGFISMFQSDNDPLVISSGPQGVIGLQPGKY